MWLLWRIRKFKNIFQVLLQYVHFFSFLLTSELPVQPGALRMKQIVHSGDCGAPGKAHRRPALCSVSPGSYLSTLLSCPLSLFASRLCPLVLHLRLRPSFLRLAFWAQPSGPLSVAPLCGLTVHLCDRLAHGFTATCPTCTRTVCRASLGVGVGSFTRDLWFLWICTSPSQEKGKARSPSIISRESEASGSYWDSLDRLGS